MKKWLGRLLIHARSVEQSRGSRRDVHVDVLLMSMFPTPRYRPTKAPTPNGLLRMVAISTCYRERGELRCGVDHDIDTYTNLPTALDGACAGNANDIFAEIISSHNVRLLPRLTSVDPVPIYPADKGDNGPDAMDATLHHQLHHLVVMESSYFKPLSTGPHPTPCLLLPGVQKA